MAKGEGRRLAGVRVIDSTEERGELCGRLLAGADAWIESHRPGELAGALGCDHTGVTDRHPHLVVTSVTDFGLTGPYRDLVGTDDVLVAMSGLLCRSGVPDRRPLLPPGSLAYDAASVTAAFATLAALPCADGYVRLVILSRRQWRAMREWLGDPEILRDEHWDQLLARMSIQQDILDPLYVELFAKYTAADLAADAQERGIVMTPVLKPPEVPRCS